MKIWRPEKQFNLGKLFYELNSVLPTNISVEPTAKINAQHLLISQKYLLTGDRLKVNKIYHIDDIINYPNPSESSRIRLLLEKLEQRIFEEIVVREVLEMDYR